MRNIYLRLLVSIVLVTVGILFVQTLVLLGSSYYVEKDWKNNVFDDYVKQLDETLSSRNAFTFTDMFNTLVATAPDRISGILIRDEQGNMNISIGSSGRGEFIPQLRLEKAIASPRTIETEALTLPRTLEISVSTTSSYESEEIPKAKYIVNMESTLIGRDMLIDDFVIEKNFESGTDVVKLPDVIQAGDIAGTLLFYNNGEIYGYVDVIVYDINMYGPVSMVLKALYSVMLYFLPFAILVTLISAYTISKHNAKHIKDIQDALNDLSEGKFETGLGRKKISITEFRTIADSIEKLGKDLERHQKSRKEWIRNISHDLNTPVTSMNVLLSGAADGLFPLDETLIASLRKENDTLSSRIASVTYYSKLLSPDQKLDVCAFRLSDLFGEFLMQGDQMSLEIPEDLTLEADYSLVRRALQEIMKNAVEYRSGGTVDVIAEKKDGYVTVIVVNAGSLPEPRPQFFEPWARGDESRHQGGSGLGLPIVYQIMELHGGSVDIDEASGFVSVTLRFPQE